MKKPPTAKRSGAFSLSESVDNYMYAVERSGVYFSASGKKWYFKKLLKYQIKISTKKRMKFVITKKSSRVGDKVFETKVVRVVGVRIREKVLITKKRCSSENTDIQ